MTDPPDAAGSETSLRAVFAVPAFRSLWSAELLSIAGDQLARVSLAVLVFARTGSAGLTGLTYAATFVPSFFGGVFLGGLGDRFRRRDVMVFTDVSRGILVACAAIPECPLWLVAALVTLTTVLGGPFRGAQQAMLPEVLSGSLYVSGMAVRNITIQAAQLTGFGLGGLFVAGVGASKGLGLDAASFAASALLLRIGLRAGPRSLESRPSFWAGLRAGAAEVFTRVDLRHLMTLSWLAGFYVVPEALAAPLAAQLGGGATAVGLLMASDPAGSVVGGLIFSKLRAGMTSTARLAPLGIAAGVPLALCALNPGLTVAMLLFAVSGFFATGYNIHATACFVRLLPAKSRAQGSSLLTSGLVAVQGLGALASGLLADYLTARTTIALFGLGGMTVAFYVWLSVGNVRRQHSTSTQVEADRSELAP